MTDNRDVDPDLARLRVLGDTYLFEVYESCLTRMIELSDNNSVERLDILELGSAGGITKDLFPSIVTSDVRAAYGVDVLISGDALPYPDNSLDLILAKDTLHHISDPETHFREVSRVLRSGGRAVYLEPNWNRISRLVFTWFHPEPFDPKAQRWGFESSNPMNSNQALAHNIFVRDRSRYDSLFPNLKAQVLESDNGLAFLLSGGVHTRTPIPASWLSRVRRWESRHPMIIDSFGVNRFILLEKLR